MVERIGITNRSQETTMRYHLHQNIIRTQMYGSTMPQRAQFEEDWQIPEIDEDQLDVAEFAHELRETFGELSSAASDLVDQDQDQAQDRDREEIMSDIEDFVQAFEDTMDFIEGRIVSGEMERIGDRLTGTLELDRSDLEDIGIDFDSQGRMTIREEAMEESIEDDLETVEETLSDVAARVANIADEVLRTPPSRYMGEEQTRQEGIFELDDFRTDQHRLFDQLGRSVYPFPAFQGLIFDFTM